MGKSTSINYFQRPFSIAFCHKLPEGINPISLVYSQHISSVFPHLSPRDPWCPMVHHPGLTGPSHATAYHWPSTLGFEDFGSPLKLLSTGALGFCDAMKIFGKIGKLGWKIYEKWWLNWNPTMKQIGNLGSNHEEHGKMRILTRNMGI